MLPSLKDFLTERVAAKDIHAAWPDAEKSNSMPGKVARQTGHHLLQKQLEYQVHPGTYRYVGTAYGHHHYHSKSPSGNERVFHHEQPTIAKNGAAKYAHTGVYHGQHMEDLSGVPGTNMTETRKKPVIKISHKGPIGYKIADIGKGGKEYNVITKDYPLKEVFSDAIHIKKGTVQSVPKSAPDDPEIWIARHPQGKIHYTRDKKWAHAWAKGTTKELDKPQEWKKHFVPPAKLHENSAEEENRRYYASFKDPDYRGQPMGKDHVFIARRMHPKKGHGVMRTFLHADKDTAEKHAREYIRTGRAPRGSLKEYMEPLHFLSRMEPEDNQTKSAEFLTKLSQVLPKDEAEEQGIREGMENLEPGKHIYLGQGGEVRHPDKSQKHYYLAHHKEKGLALFGHDNKDVVELRARQYAANGAHHHLQEDIRSIKREILELKRDMKKNGIPIRSFMNGGHTPESMRANQELFRLKTALEREQKSNIYEDANLLAREDAMNPGTHRRNKNGTFSAAHPSSGKIRHFWSPDAAKSFASGKKYELPLEVRTKIAKTAMDSYRKKHGLAIRSEDKLAVPLLTGS